MKLFFLNLNLIFIFSVFVFANESKPQQSSTPAKISSAQSAIETQVPQMPPPAEALPQDFEFIGINPYFKNKERIGHMSATLNSENATQNLAAITSDFGDCKTCLRGASVKGKIGLRLYGRTLETLMVSVKYSSSIKISKCPTAVPLKEGSYTCEFNYQNKLMKLVVKVGP